MPSNSMSHLICIPWTVLERLFPILCAATKHSVRIVAYGVRTFVAPLHNWISSIESDSPITGEHPNWSTKTSPFSSARVSAVARLKTLKFFSAAPATASPRPLRMTAPVAPHPVLRESSVNVKFILTPRWLCPWNLMCLHYSPGRMVWGESLNSECCSSPRSYLLSFDKFTPLPPNVPGTRWNNFLHTNLSENQWRC
jgi:hypothetical protein